MPLPDIIYTVLNGIQKRLKGMPDGTHADIIAGYDLQDDMLKVKSVQKKFRDSFVAASLDTARWDSAAAADGSIVTSAGTLVMSSGITALAETWIMTKETFSVPFRVQSNIALSQRIADQAFYLEAVSVDPETGLPDGLHTIGWQFEGTSATQAKYRVGNGGLAPLISAAVTTTSSAAPGGVYELEPFADEAWFHTATMDSTQARTYSFRRHQQIPDPNATYKIRLRWANSAVPPVSSTTATVQFVSVQDYAELTAEITAGRGQAAAGQGIGVTLAGGTAIAVGPVAHDGARSTTAPIINAGRAVTTPYTAVATGDVADFVTTTQGAQIVRPWQIPEQEWSYASAAGGITNTTDVVLAAAAGTGLRRYITSVDLKNISATATEVVIKDGATVLWRGHLSASMTEPVEIAFYNPLKTTANAALNFACITTGAQVYVNAQGYTAP